jgi:large subunit ribosomal protein L25
MTEVNSIGAEPRDRAGKGAARQTRREGRIPAVIYGDKQEPVMISLEPRSFTKEFHRPGFFAKLLDITVDGKTHRTLPRDVQVHPVSEHPLHADFMRVGADTRITVGIPVRFINQERAPGIKRGGLLNVVRHEIELVCRADNIPDHIDVDLDGLEIGDSIHISAVTIPEGTRLTIERNFTIASIAPPSAVREEAQAAAAAAAAALAAGEAATAEGAAPGAAPAAPGAAPGAAGGAAAGGAAKPEAKKG